MADRQNNIKALSGSVIGRECIIDNWTLVRPERRICPIDQTTREHAAPLGKSERSHEVFKLPGASLVLWFKKAWMISVR